MRGNFWKHVRNRRLHTILTRIWRKDTSNMSSNCSMRKMEVFAYILLIKNQLMVQSSTNTVY